MRELTERQRNRRARILEAARELIAERGYDGVTMRDLAARSDVALKTLYLQYESKENLLTTAVEEVHRTVYEGIDATDIDTGFDRLFYIVDTVCDTMLQNQAFAKTTAQIFGRGTTPESYSEIRTNTYRKAVQQIADEGDLLPWVDVDGMTTLMLRHRASINIDWGRGKIRTEDLADGIKLHLCASLVAFTQGKTLERAREAIEPLFEKSLAHGTTL